MRIWALVYLSVVRHELGRASAIAEMPLMSDTNAPSSLWYPPIELAERLCECKKSAIAHWAVNKKVKACVGQATHLSEVRLLFGSMSATALGRMPLHVA